MAGVHVNAVFVTSTESEPPSIGIVLDPKNLELAFLVRSHGNRHGIANVVTVAMYASVNIVADLYARELELGMVTPDEARQELTQMCPFLSAC